MPPSSTEQLGPVVPEQQPLEPIEFLESPSSPLQSFIEGSTYDIGVLHEIERAATDPSTLITERGLSPEDVRVQEAAGTFRDKVGGAVRKVQNAWGGLRSTVSGMAKKHRGSVVRLAKGGLIAAAASLGIWAQEGDNLALEGKEHLGEDSIAAEKYVVGPTTVGLRIKAEIANERYRDAVRNLYEKEGADVRATELQNLAKDILKRAEEREDPSAFFFEEGEVSRATEVVRDLARFYKENASVLAGSILRDRSAAQALDALVVLGKKLPVEEGRALSGELTDLLASTVEAHAKDFLANGDTASIKRSFEMGKKARDASLATAGTTSGGPDKDAFLQARASSSRVFDALYDAANDRLASSLSASQEGGLIYWKGGEEKSKNALAQKMMTDAIGLGGNKGLAGLEDLFFREQTTKDGSPVTRDGAKPSTQQIMALRRGFRSLKMIPVWKSSQKSSGIELLRPRDLVTYRLFQKNNIMGVSPDDYLSVWNKYETGILREEANITEGDEVLDTNFSPSNVPMYSLSRLIEIEKASPGAAKILSDQFNIKLLGRYSKEVLLAQAHEAGKPGPQGAIIMPTTDHNEIFMNEHGTEGVFQSARVQGLHPRIFEAGSRVGLAGDLLRGVEKNGKYRFITVNGHGNPNSVEVAPWNKGNDSGLLDASFFGDSASTTSLILEKDAAVFFNSCSTGKDTGEHQSIARQVSQSAGATVVAPNEDAPLPRSARVTINNEGKVSFDISLGKKDPVTRIIFRGGKEVGRIAP